MSQSFVFLSEFMADVEADVERARGPAPFYEACVRSAPIVTGILLRVPWTPARECSSQSQKWSGEKREAQTARLLRVSGCDMLMETKKGKSSYVNAARQIKLEEGVSTSRPRPTESSETLVHSDLAHHQVSIKSQLHYELWDVIMSSLFIKDAPVLPTLRR